MSFRQLHVGREEPIIDAHIPIIDAHHHLFDRPALRYMADEYLKDVAAGHRVVASVYVETLAFARRDGPEMFRPLGEVEFANGVGAMGASGVYGECRLCAAIVGYADLRHGAAIGEYLDRALALAPDRLRGMRQIVLDDPSELPYRFMTQPPPRAIMRHPEFRNGLRQMDSRGLVFDTAVFHHQLPSLAELADAFPGMTIVLDNLGHTMGMGLSEAERIDVFKAWRKALIELAKRPNVVCKIGGLGLPFWGFGLEARPDPIGFRELATLWRPYVESAIEGFGVGRCMMESNYPPDGRSCGFVPLWNALKAITREATESEKLDLFAGTAARVYRIALDPVAPEP